MRVKTVCQAAVGLLVVTFLSRPATAEVRIKASPVKQDLSLDPFDSMWERVPSVHVPLMAQELFTPRGGGATSELLVQTLVTSTHLSLRLQWADATASSAQDVHRTEAFDDAVAVQVPLHPQDGYPSPFMGDTQHPVSIWHWKASWQDELEMSQAHPRTVRDSEPFAETPTFRTGEAVGNLFSQPRRTSSVEQLLASGFGTLTPTQEQPVEGRGVWRDGYWSVVMHRALVPRGDTVEVDLRGLESIPIAFAVWDGARQERDGMKSISVWQTLVFERPMPWWKRLMGMGAQQPTPQPASVENHVVRRTEPLVAQGRRVFERAGCASCHGLDGRGGVRNPNAWGAEEIPPLVFVGAAFSEEELKEEIRQGALPAKLDPQGSGPDRVMPAWHPVMGEEELEELTAYLLSLLPEDSESW